MCFNNGGAVAAHRRGVEQRHVLGNHARLLQLLDAPQAGRRRQMHLLGEIGVRDPAIRLQDAQDGAVA
jgi:hypothetical protein